MNPDECVSAIIPARNEERTIAEAVISVAEQPEIREVVVVNDQSSDGTGEILRRLAAGQPRLRVCEAGPLPAGWVGKNHAASLGAQKAACDWLLFTDADALHLPGSTGRALAEANSRGADLVSYSPGQEMHTWWERALIPFVFCRLSLAFCARRPDLPRAHVFKFPSDVGRLVEESASLGQLVRPASDAGVAFGDAMDSIVMPVAYAVAYRLRRAGTPAAGRAPCELRGAAAEESFPAR